MMRAPGAGWSSPVARRAHNPKVVSSNLAPATNFQLPVSTFTRLFDVTGQNHTLSIGDSLDSCYNYADLNENL